MNIVKLFGVIIVIAITCYLRLGVISNTIVDEPIRADAYQYYNYAYNLKYFGTYSESKIGQEKIVPDSIRAPGYPVFLVPLIEWPPTDAMLLKINLYQAILGVFTVLFAWLIYKRMMSYRYALIAAFLTAISPHLVSFTVYLLTETLFTFLLVLSVWLVLIAHEKKHLALTFLAGVLIAFCALTRPTLNYFIILVIIFIVFQCGHRQGVKYALSMLIGFILVFFPWTIRSMIVQNNVPSKSLIINTIHHGMYPDFIYQGIEESKGFPYRFDPDGSKISANFKSLLAELSERFHNETWRHTSWFLLGKPIALFSWEILNGWGDIFIYPVIKTPYIDNFIFKLSRQFMYWTHWILISMSLCACVVVWFPSLARTCDSNKLFVGRLLSILIMYFLVLHIIAAPFPRYSVPIRPFNYGMAMFFLSLIASLKNKNKL
ncbi:MAG: 4-amino-4-deoxy-L-arabinose transferase-like glycosyltransferase [Gammaproteobacteria bacterium]